LIRNETGAAVPALKILAGDLILAFDLSTSDAERIPLSVAADPSARYVTVVAYGRSADATALTASETVRTDALVRPIEFEILLRRDAISIVGRHSVSNVADDCQ
jgi:3-keto-L-gulonate-6-phosphate decarboxylase